MLPFQISILSVRVAGAANADRATALAYHRDVAGTVLELSDNASATGNSDCLGEPCAGRRYTSPNKIQGVCCRGKRHTLILDDDATTATTTGNGDCLSAPYA